MSSCGQHNLTGQDSNRLRVVRMGIDTHQAIVFMRRDCHVCRAEGFNVLSRIELALNGNRVITTLAIVDNELLTADSIGLPDATLTLLGAKPGDCVAITHAPTLESMADVRAKMYGRPFSRESLHTIIRDVVAGSYGDVQLASLITVCANTSLDIDEVAYLTEAMVATSERLSWAHDCVLDKHCVGGLPGNRTTPLVVAIVAANGFCIPKTSSRAITSPAGTADTMETLAPVDLDLASMRRVVEREGGCIVWGGAVNLSPADDILIRVERVLDIDSEGQLVASVLSKKIAAGASTVLIDIPVGPTAKIRSIEKGEALADMLVTVGRRLGLAVRVHLSDGSKPVGRGIGPALEARDLLAVFQNAADAPADLRARALDLAGVLLEMGGIAKGQGRALAEHTLHSGRAWQKFQAICAAQGGLREPPTAVHQRPIVAAHDGYVRDIDSRVLSRLAKLTGAPASPAAGLYLHARVGDRLSHGEPLFTLHAATKGELAYALDYYHRHPGVFTLQEVLQ